MTTAQDQQSRAECRKAFEFELIDNHSYVPSDLNQIGGFYADDDVQFAWEAAWAVWQAARALPATSSVSNAGSGVLPAGVEPAFTRRHEDVCGDEVGPPEFGYTAAQLLAMGRVPPGWQAVPVEPTPEMAVAGLTHGGIAAALAYQDMLAAAPQPPAAPATPGPQATTTGAGGVTAGAVQDQHARDSAELRRLCQERDSARRERDLGKVEIAALESSCATLERLVDELRAKADRYDYLRERDLNTISEGGVFAGETPDNVVLNGEDLDAAIDAALKATP